MAIDYKDVLGKRDQFITVLRDKIAEWIDPDAEAQNIKDLAEELLIEGWVVIDD